MPENVAAIAARVEAFVRDIVVPYERDPRRDHHDCPTDELVAELKDRARAAGVLTPHILPDGRHLTQRDTVVEQVFREIRAFRIYDGPTEVHKWSLAKAIRRGWQEAQA